MFGKRRRSEEHRLAIRCSYCLHVFCRKCAAKHFAPMIRTQNAVDRALETLAVEALEKVMERLPADKLARVR